jgi:hypothetical protein
MYPTSHVEATIELDGQRASKHQCNQRWWCSLPDGNTRYPFLCCRECVLYYRREGTFRSRSAIRVCWRVSTSLVSCLFCLSASCSCVCILRRRVLSCPMLVLSCGCLVLSYLFLWLSCLVLVCILSSCLMAVLRCGGFVSFRLVLHCLITFYLFSYHLMVPSIAERSIQSQPLFTPTATDTKVNGLMNFGGSGRLFSITQQSTLRFMKCLLLRCVLVVFHCLRLSCLVLRFALPISVIVMVIMMTIVIVVVVVVVFYSRIPSRALSVLSCSLLLLSTTVRRALLFSCLLPRSYY